MSSPYVPPDPQGPYGYGQSYDETARYGQYAVPANAPGSPYAPAGGYVVPARPQNSLALVGMILSLVGLVSGVTAIAGIICGHIARKQIRQTGEDGDGMALTALIVGYIVCGLMLAYLAFVVVYFIFIIGVIGASSTTSGYLVG